MDNQQPKTNVDHTRFKNPLQDHGKGKASSLGNNSANYTNVTHDYTIHHIRTLDEHVATITINSKSS